MRVCQKKWGYGYDRPISAIVRAGRQCIYNGAPQLLCDEFVSGGLGLPNSLLQHFNAGRILSIDRVWDELFRAEDALSVWAQNAPAGLFATSLQNEITDDYRDVMQ